jgi:hypothetical protein
MVQIIRDVFEIPPFKIISLFQITLEFGRIIYFPYKTGKQHSNIIYILFLNLNLLYINHTFKFEPICHFFPSLRLFGLRTEIPACRQALKNLEPGTWNLEPGTHIYSALYLNPFNGFPSTSQIATAASQPPVPCVTFKRHVFQPFFSFTGKESSPGVKPLCTLFW